MRRDTYPPTVDITKVSWPFLRKVSLYIGSLLNPFLKLLSKMLAADPASFKSALCSSESFMLLKMSPTSWASQGVCQGPAGAVQEITKCSIRVLQGFYKGCTGIMKVVT